MRATRSNQAVWKPRGCEASSPQPSMIFLLVLCKHDSVVNPSGTLAPVTYRSTRRPGADTSSRSLVGERARLWVIGLPDYALSPLSAVDVARNQSRSSTPRESRKSLDQDAPQTGRSPGRVGMAPSSRPMSRWSQSGRMTSCVPGEDSGKTSARRRSGLTCPGDGVLPGAGPAGLMAWSPSGPAERERLRWNAANLARRRESALRQAQDTDPGGPFARAPCGGLR